MKSKLVAWVLAEVERFEMIIFISVSHVHFCLPFSKFRLILFTFFRFADISTEIETSLDMQSMAGTESSFKCPPKESLVEIENHVCTIENMIVPEPPPPTSSIVKITTRSCH